MPANEALRAARRAWGLSQTLFARKLGVDRGVLANMETGRRRIGPEMARRIAKAARRREWRFFWTAWVEAQMGGKDVFASHST